MLLFAWCPLLIQETAFAAHPDALWVAAVKDDMRRLEADPNALLITPMVLEIIAEKA